MPDLSCEVCNAKVTELRRGRCWGCYTKWADARPVGIGAACITCNDRRREHLRTVELLAAWVPMCHNCAARATKLSPMPQTIEEIRERLIRDRRRLDRRTAAKADTRVFPRERRGLDRRRGDGDEAMLISDEDILLMEDLEELAVSGLPELPEPGEETRIQLPPDTNR